MTSSSRRVLFIENERDLVDCLRTLLTEQGYEVYAVSDGRAACEMCRHEPLLVFMDLHIDGPLRGTELVAALRCRLPAFARLYLFSGDRDLEERARALGADGCLEKPFSVEGLIEIVEHERAVFEAIAALTKSDDDDDEGPPHSQPADDPESR